MRVKICGIAKADQGQAIANMGATALGFICVPASRRYITPSQIRAIAQQLPSSVDRIGVFANADLETICQVTAEGKLNGVQLHGDETPQQCDRLRELLPGVEIIKALRVKSPETLNQVPNYSDRIHTLLLDAYHPNQLGGTGQAIDRTILEQFRPTCPWFLAGGLTPDNVLEVLQQIQPSGIDLSSGLERAPGDKDLAKVAQLFEKLKSLSGLLTVDC